MTEKNDLSLRPTAPHTSTSHDSWPVTKNLVKNEPTEDEDYTIKCICGVAEDDGNTVLCDKCDTWQHIGCYYPDNVQDIGENFSHLCIDCHSRPLNRERAVERMRKFGSGSLDDEDEEEEERREKKSKRRMSKSSKKKPKSSDIHYNTAPTTSHKGSRSDHSSSHSHGQSNTQSQPQNHDSHHHHHQHQHKKSKSAHKISYSTNSHSGKRSPSYGKPPSPASTPPDLPIEFDLRKNSPTLIPPYDLPGVEIVQTNTFASIEVLNTMSTWARDPKRLAQDTKEQFRDVFQPVPANDISRCKDIFIGHMKCSSSGVGSDMRVQYLATRAPIAKETPIVEINGNVGFQNHYCAIPENNWSDYITPLPFVFFHPRLPLYIDTRREGSDARYVRRSCKPNATLETFLSDQEYRFWLVSDRYVGADEQITLPWDFRIPLEQKARVMALLGLNTDDDVRYAEPDMDLEEFQLHSTWLQRVLVRYGGCACDLGDNCAFKRFNRSFLAKAQARTAALQKKKTSRKPKSHVVSPSSTVPLPDSRAPSEMRLDDVAESEIRATPDVRSKASSRERSPPRPAAAFDQPGILTEPTDRDKRKVAMVEDSFRRMEQQQPPRKKKRVMSDGSQAGNNTNAANSNTSSNGNDNSGGRSSSSSSSNSNNNNNNNSSSSSSSSSSTSANITSVANTSTSTSTSANTDTNANTNTDTSVNVNATASTSTNSANPHNNAAQQKASKTRGGYADASTMSGKSTSSASGGFTAPSRRSTSRQNSTVPRSRQTSLAPSLLNQPRAWTYTDSSTQTDPNDDDLFVPRPAPARPVRRVVSLARRLMDARKLHLEELARRAAACPVDSVSGAAVTAAGGESMRHKRLSEAFTADGEDHAMSDVSSDSSLTAAGTQDAATKKPGDARHLPPVITSSSVTGAGGPMAVTMSPFSCSLQNTFMMASSPGVAPSPVKKKLSLSDYTKSRANKSAAAAAAAATTSTGPMTHKPLPASKLANSEVAGREEGGVEGEST